MPEDTDSVLNILQNRIHRMGQRYGVRAPRGFAQELARYTLAIMKRSKELNDHTWTSQDIGRLYESIVMIDGEPRNPFSGM